MTDPAIAGAASGDAGSLQDDGSEQTDVQQLLREKDERIAMLERARAKQDEALSVLREELGSVQIKHKEETYWLRLELDTIRREKEATEDRMAELYRDMREIDNMAELDDPMGAPVTIDQQYVLHLQSQLSKSMQTMGVLDNQIGMVKRSCDAVVTSMKEEIADVMEDKSRMELEMMNQLAALDGEKQDLESAWEERVIRKEDRIKAQDEIIASLRETITELESRPPPLEQIEDAGGENGPVDADSQRSEDVSDPAVVNTETGEETKEKDEKQQLDEKEKEVAAAAAAAAEAAAAAAAAKTEELQRQAVEEAQRKAQFETKKIEMEFRTQVSKLKDEKRVLEERLKRVQRELKDEISGLDETVTAQEDQIEALQADLAAARQSSAKEASAFLEAISKDRDETLQTLERVAEIWEKADESIQVLEDVMDILRPYEDDDEGAAAEDRERALTTLDAAALVHAQIKVTLLLVELKLRNQLTSLKSDRHQLSLENAVVGAATAAAGTGGVLPSSSASNRGGDDATTSAEVLERIDELQTEAFMALQQVEENMTDQIRGLEASAKGETRDLRAELKASGDTIVSLRQKVDDMDRRTDLLRKANAELENTNDHLRKEADEVRTVADEREKEVKRLKDEAAKASAETAAAVAAAAADQQKQKTKQQEADEAKRAAAAAEENDAKLRVSHAMLEKLQNEIYVVVSRIREKNDTITKLTSAVEEHKVRETALKKELKRIMKRVRAIEEG